MLVGLCRNGVFKTKNSGLELVRHKNTTGKQVFVIGFSNDRQSRFGVLRQHQDIRAGFTTKGNKHKGLPY
jgi:hypothetical protein